MLLNKKETLLMWTILIIALVQMPVLALTPAINQIQTNVFPDRSLAQVQTALAWTNLVSPLTSIAALFFINKGVVTKKGAVVAGLLILGTTSLLAINMHTQFWHLIFLSVFLGLATGCFMTNAFALLFDNFSEHDRQIIAGYQTSCINIGGISMSLLGGVLATAAWYGGYFILLVGFPIAVLAFFAVPNYKSPSESAAKDKKGARLNPRIFYYAALTFLFMMVYGVGSNNISTHIKQNIQNVNDATIAGIAVAIQMCGGVVSGLFFGKLSKKYKDLVFSAACFAVFAGFLILTLFAASIVMLFIGVFVTGISLSLALPQCIFAVSTLVDKSTSAAATVIASSAAPSLGGLMSPIVFTNLTIKLFGDSTAHRYAFVACAALILGVAAMTVTIVRTKKTGIGL